MKIVKFVKFNENTLSNLINYQVHFSTIYQFNDFGEFRFLASPSDFKDISSESSMTVNTYLANNYAEVLQGVGRNPFSCPEYIDGLRQRLKANTQLNANDKSAIAEYIAYSNVGIFCTSNIDVFKTIAAKLMFAHYGDSNKGIALVYQGSGERTFPVEYNSILTLASFGQNDRLVQWAEGNFKDMDDFIFKANEWCYENEMRIFSRPGLCSCREVGLTLEAILYTPNFDKKKIKTLNNLNGQIYADKLKIHEIYPWRSCNKSFYVIPSDGSGADEIDVYDLLSNSPHPNPLPQGERE